MAWFGLDKLLLGVDLSAEQQRSNQADQQLLALNQQLVDQGTWTQAQADAAAQKIAAGNADTGAGNVVASVDQSFAQGLQQGEQNITSGISDTIARLIKDVWAAIPWQLWVVALVVLFVWMGGLAMLKGRLAKK